MSEMKSLKLNGKTYDSFVDKTAREAIDNLEIPEGGTVTPEQIASAVEDYMAENPVIPGATVEPAEDDIPCVYLYTDGAGMPFTKNEGEKQVRMVYASKTKNESYYVTAKVQGGSSATESSYKKRNWTIKVYKDSTYEEKQKLKFKGWPSMNKFVLKAGWVIPGHLRNVGAAQVWGQIMKTRTDFDSLPEELRNSPNLGATDGFHVRVFVDGMYWGVYDWIVAKDQLFGQDKDNPAHSILNSEWNNNYTCSFATTNPSLNNNWSEELQDDLTTDTKVSMENWIKFVAGSSDEDFVANAENYFDVQSVIDAICFDRIIMPVDNMCRNQIVFKYSDKWYMGKWDLDAILGLPPVAGQQWFSYNTPYQEGYVAYKDFKVINKLYKRTEELFKGRFMSRYWELRSGVLSENNLVRVFGNLSDRLRSIEGLLKEENATTTGNGQFTGMPNVETDTIYQIREMIVKRCAYMDGVVRNMVDPIPATGISLSATTLTFDNTDPKTLTATVVPSNSTDIVTWRSSNSSIATVKSGLVTPIKNGNVTITATAGNVSAECAVTISGIDEEPEVPDTPDIPDTPNIPTENLRYMLPEPTVFDGVDDYVDTGLQLCIPPRDVTVFIDFQTDADCPKGGNIWYCQHDNTPYAGLNLFWNGSNHSLSGKVVSLAIGERHKLLVTYSHEELVARYTSNGVIPASGNSVTRPTQTSDGVTVTENLSLGSGEQPNGNRNAFWKGTIYQCMVWDGILSAEQIAELFNMGEPVPATGISLSDNTLSFDSTEPKTLTATVVPANSTNVVFWSSSDDSIATVKNGLVTPIKNGNVTITATAGNVFAECAVTISGIDDEEPDTPDNPGSGEEPPEEEPEITEVDITDLFIYDGTTIDGLKQLKTDTNTSGDQTVRFNPLPNKTYTITTYSDGKGTVTDFRCYGGCWTELNEDGTVKSGNYTNGAISGLTAGKVVSTWEGVTEFDGVTAGIIKIQFTSASSVASNKYINIACLDEHVPHVKCSYV